MVMSSRRMAIFDEPLYRSVLENGGDVFETVEEMYGMIWFLAGTYAYRDPRAAVEDARKQYQEGLKKAREVNG
jgi:hypothetical protein